MSGRILLKLHGPVPRDVESWVRYGCKHLRKSGEVRHDLDVLLFGLNGLPVPDDVEVVRVSRGPRENEVECTTGLFGWFADPEMMRTGRPTIAIAGKVPAVIGREGPVRCGHIMRTFAHELAHYVQFRDGKAHHGHRGIERATMRLLRVLAPGATMGEQP